MKHTVLLSLLFFVSSAYTMDVDIQLAEFDSDHIKNLELQVSPEHIEGIVFNGINAQGKKTYVKLDVSSSESIMMRTVLENRHSLIVIYHRLMDAPLAYSYGESKNHIPMQCLPLFTEYRISPEQKEKLREKLESLESARWINENIIQNVEVSKINSFSDIGFTAKANLRTYYITLNPVSDEISRVFLHYDKKGNIRMPIPDNALEILKENFKKYAALVASITFSKPFDWEDVD